MIDGYFKDRLDRCWNRLAPALVALGFDANRVTWTGFGLSAAAAATYPLYREPGVFGVLILLTFAFDSLDGAVARHLDAGTLYGGYLDAMTDRWQEILAFAALGWVHGWGGAFFAVTGALAVSYAKARCAVEMPIDNAAWPDLMERLERTLTLGFGLIAASFVPWPASFRGDAVTALLLLLGALCHATAVQRFLRARRMLRRRDAERSEKP
jgi:CDP-diacylglycerol--glycerol-3-phosphate 3-phosphatidyltransferase/archaetidylinositol phosphate synthase